ncbi:hypothetical protein [Chryseobacterium sp. Marseille-Q3244]|uniref:hypothetical protein n=1 Tax=Chryseobacterium sp. Marseille-Q3244 TaxID=2758092 RepID=UPI00202581B8|nr:hypothetical protein [Chryseobacterium sp. Marseille-Q3244]
MIYRFLILVCLFGTMISCKGHDSKDNKVINNSILENVSTLPETWRWRSEDKSQEFTIKIQRITKDSLFAQYCAVYNNGQKLDCDFEQNTNIKAIFNKDKNAYVGEFHSFFNSGKGTCLIKIIDKNLNWEIIKTPDGEYYAPTKCILRKENKIESKDNPEAKKTNQANNSIPISNVLPLDYKNLSDKIKLETPSDNNIKNLFKQKYQLNVDAMAQLPSKGNFDFYIINNMSGDSDLLYLVTLKEGKLIDGLEVGNSNGDSDETTVFSINEKYEISIYSENNNKRKLIALYSLNDMGNFNKQKAH